MAVEVFLKILRDVVLVIELLNDTMIGETLMTIIAVYNFEECVKDVIKITNGHTANNHLKCSALYFASKVVCFAKKKVKSSKIFATLL